MLTKEQIEKSVDNMTSEQIQAETLKMLMLIRQSNKVIADRMYWLLFIILAPMVIAALIFVVFGITGGFADGF